jgi:hypothetical protein
MRLAFIVGIGLLSGAAAVGLIGCGGRPTEPVVITRPLKGRLPIIRGKPGAGAQPPKLQTAP